MSDQKHPTAGIWGLVIVGALVLYPASLGPSCWLSSRFGGAKSVTVAYRPLTWACRSYESEIVAGVVKRFARVCAADGWDWRITESSMPGGWKH